MKTAAKFSASSNLLLRCLSALLVPLARFCIRRSIKFQDFLEVAKAAFVNAAGEEAERKGLDVSHSRISLMTGVHRKDVTRLRSGDTRARVKTNLFTRVVGMWLTHRRFSKGGAPRPLTFEGPDCEFADLVREVSREVKPHTVLFELERLSFVKKQGGTLHLKVQHYVPRHDTVPTFGIAGDDIGDLLEAVTENTFHPQEVPHLHLRTEYDNISPEMEPKIRAWFMREGEQLHERARRFLSRLDADVNEKVAGDGARLRASITSSSFIETEILSIEKKE